MQGNVCDSGHCSNQSWVDMKQCLKLVTAYFELAALPYLAIISDAKYFEFHANKWTKQSLAPAGSTSTEEDAPSTGNLPEPPGKERLPQAAEHIHWGQEMGLDTKDLLGIFGEI